MRDETENIPVTSFDGEPRKSGRLFQDEIVVMDKTLKVSVYVDTLRNRVSFGITSTEGDKHYAAEAFDIAFEIL